MDQPQDMNQPKEMDQITLHIDNKGHCRSGPDRKREDGPAEGDGSAQEMDQLQEMDQPQEKDWIILRIDNKGHQFQHQQQVDGNSQQNHICRSHFEDQQDQLITG
nr:hypothetical protein BaRGS_006834 [Batillaria attramentaria]